MTTVNICGIPYKVIDCKDNFDVDTHLGIICYKENEIRINEEMPENQKKETLCHEMVHGMLIHLGFDDLSNNEQFVQALGNAIYQGFEIKEHKGTGEIQCNYTDSEIAKSFIEDVEAVKDLLPQTESGGNMTREEAKEFIAQSVKSDVDMALVADAIKALEQEPNDVLDKIRAEIEAKCCITVGRENDGAITLYDVFEIIDKYRGDKNGTCNKT